jgi:PAS domain S-box-containing protein
MDINNKIQEIETLTNAYHDFTQIINRFEETFKALQAKVDLLNKQLEIKNLELEKKYAEGETIMNFLNSVLENIYTGVIVTDNKGIVTHFNRAAEMITGYNKDEILGKNYKMFSIPKNTDSRSALYTLSTGKESYHRQKNILTSDKQEKRVEFSTTLLKDHSGNLLGVVETFNDISEVKILQDRINHIETLAALGEMSASVAHEIRNPLAGITGFAGLLDRQIPEDDPKKNLVKSIIVGTTKLNEIISNLLTLTRPQNLNITQVNLHNFLNDLISYFKETFPLREKSIKIELEVDNQDTTIYLDVQLFQQIILNLLKNACDAIENKGKITIKTKCNIFEPVSEILEEDEKSEMIKLFSDVEIAITDTGSGIPEEIVRKVFNPFFTTKNEGNGLGLAICKKIVQLHKGDIHIKSHVGKGTTFTINLPLFEQPT